ncbi:MAG: DbpA RNA binding domain-containing protein [Spirochaetaceae bacterium]|nr:DbpA RNA binding domain-containing protein [Spirochaetaceae bacterium]
MVSRIDKEKLTAYIKDLVEKIHTEADVGLLNAYRSAFRKGTSFFNRSYVAAYLLMQSEAARGGKFRASRSSGASSARSPGALFQKGKDQGKNDEGRVSLPEEESARLFISIGRNRRVYPREILSLITGAGASRDDVGTIRILDNYSFVQVRNTAADSIIDALHGKTFRGRTLTVNYARNRGEDESASDGETTEASDG